MPGMDSSNTSSESTQTLASDLMQPHRRPSRSRDSPHSPRNQDSGFLTNSWESREMSPTRDLLRKTRSRSPSLGRYVYKSPTETSLRNNLLATFENFELEKVLLKDENRDIREEMIQLQNQFRQLEKARERDAERFDLQQREVDALRLQLKIEKEGRSSNASLVEELQSDLSRKTELLSLSNEELIEARDRARVLEKQLHDEGDARSLTERVIREYRERMEDISNDLEMERKVSKTAMENIREDKGRIDQLKEEIKDLQEAVRLVASTFGLSVNATADPTLKLKNEEALQNLRLIIIRRNDLCQQLVTVDKNLSSRSSEVSELSDQIQNIARIVRLEFKDEITPNTLLQDEIFQEQTSSLENSKVTPVLEPLYIAILGYVKLEARKRKLVREAVSATLKQFNWKASNESREWKSLRANSKRIHDRLSQFRNSFSAAGQMMQRAQDSSRSLMTTYKNFIIINSKHNMDEALYNFVDITKSKHEAVRRSLDNNHRKHLNVANQKILKSQEQLRDEAIDVERAKIKQLEVTISGLHSIIKVKENDIDRLTDEIRTVESKLFRKTEDIQRLQFEQATELKSISQKYLEVQTALQQKVTAMQAELSLNEDRVKRDLDQRAKQIAALDEVIVAKDQKLTILHGKLKDQNGKLEELKKQLELEKDPNRDAKLRAAIKTYERETADQRAKIAERDQLISHLKRRVDEALNRGQKRLNETTERTRAELASKEIKLVEKEKEVEKLQEQLTRMSRVVARGPGGEALQKEFLAANGRGSTDRGTVLTPQPMVKNLSNARSVSGTDTTRLPPIMPAGVVGGDPNSNGQLTRRFTARSGSEKPVRRSRISSFSSQVN